MFIFEVVVTLIVALIHLERTRMQCSLTIIIIIDNIINELDTYMDILPFFALFFDPGFGFRFFGRRPRFFLTFFGFFVVVVVVPTVVVSSYSISSSAAAPAAVVAAVVPIPAVVTA